MKLRLMLFLITPPLVGALAGGVLLQLRDRADADTAPISHSFRNVARAEGLHGVQTGIPPCGLNAAGAAWGDVDGDRDLDLFLPRHEGPSQLWLQRDDGFHERAGRAGLDLAGIATAAAFADFDSDGDQDLFVGGIGPDQLYENDGGGSFTDVTFFAGTDDPGPAKGAAWADFDGDGRLDLHVANGENCTADPRPAPNRLYRNLGRGRFADVSRLLPSPAASGLTLDAVWFDADADRDPDLYLGNDDLDGQGNALLLNTGDVFRDVSQLSGADLSGFTMGVAAGDLDGDGSPDLVSTDIGRESLLLQLAPGRFSEQAEERGFGRDRARSGEQSITWGVALADFDNDADLDAFAAAGALGLDRGPQEDALYENLGGGAFRGFEVPLPGSGRTVAPADWDRDGDVDLLVAQLNGPAALLENRGRPRKHWLELRLIGRASPRDACGATLILHADGRRQWRQVECRTGDHVVHFGLGSAPNAARLQITWPSGTVQRLERVGADSLRTITEPR